MPRNLLFDLGGVIMDIRRDDCLEAFRSLGMEHPENLIGEYVQNGPFGQLESGEISVAQFHDAIRTQLPEGVTDQQIDRAFCAFITGLPQPRLAALRHLRKRRGVYLLSNTNPIMWRGVIAEEFLKEGLRREDYFDGIVTSSTTRRPISTQRHDSDTKRCSWRPEPNSPICSQPKALPDKSQ